ncbi:MAG: FIST C-terminal domain-containing protein, partial [Acidobacteria bacterium]|nr:FIST C-terminal domain-containing protein [Acidobacteriota bacterium]
NYSQLLKAIEQTCRPQIIVGCSSAGEFINDNQGEGSVSAVAIRSSDMQFAAGLGKQLRADRTAAAKQIVSSFAGLHSHNYLFRSALVLTDALAGYADDLVEQLNLQTAGTYQLFGGGAGDDAKFSQTHVFKGTEAYPDAAVALEILSNKPLGIGVSHGWKPAGAQMRVTEADGMRLISLNAAPAIEALQEHAEATNQKFDLDNPLPFFLHNVIGISTGDDYKLRVPLAVNPDGSILCAADIPTGAMVCIMNTTSSSAAEAASQAIQGAVQQLNGSKPKVALFFDCVATRLRMGGEFGLEMQAIQNALGSTMYAGCNTYGQIARAEGQFSGFHNCTATVCVIPE